MWKPSYFKLIKIEGWLGYLNQIGLVSVYAIFISRQLSFHHLPYSFVQDIFGLGHFKTQNFVDRTNIKHTKIDCVLVM